MTLLVATLLAPVASADWAEMCKEGEDPSTDECREPAREDGCDPTNGPVSVYCQYEDDGSCYHDGTNDETHCQRTYYLCGLSIRGWCYVILSYGGNESAQDGPLPGIIVEGVNMDADDFSLAQNHFTANPGTGGVVRNPDETVLLTMIINQ